VDCVDGCGNALAIAAMAAGLEASALATRSGGTATDAAERAAGASRPKEGPGTGSQARGARVAAASKRPATNDDAKIPPTLFSDMPDRPLWPVTNTRRQAFHQQCGLCRTKHRRPSRRIDSYDPKNRCRGYGREKPRSLPGK
jgi:hypothetical protein